MNALRILLLAPLLACDLDKDTGSDDTASEDTASEDAVPDLTTLTEAGGCADIVFTLSSPDRDLVLVFSTFEGLTKDAYKAGEPVTVTVPLTTPDLLILSEGNQAADFYCNDAFTDTMVIDRTWSATAGTVSITLTSEGIDHGHGGLPATGSITIEDAILTSEDGGEPLSIDALSWEASVGWLPG